MNSILQQWVTKLGLRHQGVLLTAMRGCDGAAKEDLTKSILREMRGLVLVPFDERELDYNGFMVRFPSLLADQDFQLLKKSLDHYPVHYIFHLLYAMEVIGASHPTPKTGAVYWERYVLLCRRLHVNPETHAQLHLRLNEDRIVNNTVLA